MKSTVVIMCYRPQLQCAEVKLGEIISSLDLQETGFQVTEPMLWLLVNWRPPFPGPADASWSAPVYTLFVSRVHLHKPIHSGLGFCLPEFSSFTPSALFSPTAAG